MGSRGDRKDRRALACSACLCPYGAKWSERLGAGRTLARSGGRRVCCVDAERCKSDGPRHAPHPTKTPPTHARVHFREVIRVKSARRGGMDGVFVGCRA